MHLISIDWLCSPLKTKGKLENCLSELPTHVRITLRFESFQARLLQVKYISNKKDCQEKQKLVQPDGTFNIPTTSLTIVSPSPGKPAAIKAAMRIPHQVPLQQSAAPVAMTSADGRMIMTALTQIQNRLTSIENDMTEIKAQVHEVCISTLLSRKS